MPRATRFARPILLTITALLGGSACGTTTTPSASAAPSATSVQLVPAPAGAVTLSWSSATHLVTAALDTYGFALNSQHAFRLVTGACDAPGDILAGFGDIKTDGYGAFKGSVISTQRIAAIPTGSHVDVLLGPTAQAGSAPGSTRVACATVNAANTAAPLTLNVPTLTPSSGTVSLSYVSESKTVTVHVVAKGLAPSSAHAVHIHFGSCRQQSGVLYTVGDVTSNGGGAVDTTKTITGVGVAPPAHGWYADIHDGSTASLETGGQPTLLFAPILCGERS